VYSNGLNLKEFDYLLGTAPMRFQFLKALRLGKRLAPQPDRVKQVTVSQPTPFPEARIERRQSPRRGGEPLEVFIRSDDESADSRRAWVKNRSAGGIALSVTEPVTEGIQLSVRPTLVPEGVPWVLVEVKYCRPFMGRWVLGCRFIDPPPDDVLALFG
jgi:hypothetical protein